MFEIIIGLRYLRAKRKQAFISIITIISILGVMVGVMALVVVLSVMNGFRADLMSKILGSNAHLLVLSFKGPFENFEAVKARVDAVKGVKASTPFVYTQVMVNHQGNATGAVLRGIDPETVGGVLMIDKMITKGSLALLKEKSEQPPPIMIGTELARHIGARLGDKLSVVSPEGKLTPMGRVPNSKEFRVAAIFDSGMYEYDASMVYLGLEESQRFLGLGDRITGLGVSVTDIYQSDEIALRVQEAVGYPYWTKDWKMMNKSLFSALKLEKVTMAVILTMIVLVGALNIISTLVMVVMEKTRDVAILRAMGAPAGSIMVVFMLQGLLVGVLGTLGGLASGLGLCKLLAKYQFIHLPPDVYYISTLPVRVEFLDVLFVSLAAVFISFLATLYPSWYASRLNPVEALRYE